MPTAKCYLDKAAGHMADRASTYDTPEGERSMGKTVQAFNAITNHHLTEAEGWLLLQLLKDVRAFARQGDPHQDSLEDCIAYASLKAEAMSRPQRRHTDPKVPDPPECQPHSDFWDMRLRPPGAPTQADKEELHWMATRMKPQSQKEVYGHEA